MRKSLLLIQDLLEILAHEIPSPEDVSHRFEISESKLKLVLFLHNGKWQEVNFDFNKIEAETPHEFVEELKNELTAAGIDWEYLNHEQNEIDEDN